MANKDGGGKLDFDKMISDCLAALEKTDDIINKDCVLLIGDTGIGKSTLATALCFGIGVLEEKTIKVKRRGRTKDRKVIDIKKGAETRFLIGHEFQSQTTFPNIFMKKKDELAYCDCPGFNDTHGLEQELVNCLSIHQILKKARSVKILMAFESAHLRGNNIRDSIDTLMKIFKKPTDFFEFGQSIVPVILRVAPGNGVDAQDVIDDVYEALQKSIISELKEAAHDIADRSHVVDPLDRAINNATTVEALNKKILKSPGIPKDRFNVPLTSTAQVHLRGVLTTIRDNVKSAISRDEDNLVFAHEQKLKKMQKWDVPGATEILKDIEQLKKDHAEAKRKAEKLKQQQTANEKIEGGAN
eukprot:UN01855